MPTSCYKLWVLTVLYVQLEASHACNICFGHWNIDVNRVVFGFGSKVPFAARKLPCLMSAVLRCLPNLQHSNLQ
jgi:hypothetical protein